jgi:nucleoside-diphosphate-sugar epimerase
LTLLVTGATGFTGKHLTRHLLSLGFKVRVIVRDKGKLNELLSDSNLEVRIGNIYDKEVIEKAMIGIDKVFHVAAIYRTSGIPDQVYWDTHVIATELLMNAALKNGVSRFVHTSTVGVHGDVGEEEAADENSPFNPGDIYQVTKLEAEKLAHKFYKEKGLPVSIIRPTAIYGPGDLRLLKLFKIANTKISPILGKGTIKYHMVYIDDLIQGFILASEKKEALGEAFIIGGKEVLSLNELLDNIGQILGKTILTVKLPAKPFQILGTLMEKIFIPLGISPPIYRRRVDFFTKSRIFKISKAENLLGYKPSVALYDGLNNTAIWYKQQGFIK